MKPDRIQAMLSAYLEGELSPEDKRQVGGHLNNCPACREELEFLRRYRKRMSSLQTVKAPGDLLMRIHERLDRPSPARSIFRTLFLPLKIKLPLEAAGLLAMAALVIFVIYPGGRMDKPLYVADEASIKKMKSPETKQADRAGTRMVMRERQAPSGAARQVKKTVDAAEIELVVYELALRMEPQAPAYRNAEMLSRDEDAAPGEKLKLDDMAGYEEAEQASKDSPKAVYERKSRKNIKGPLSGEKLNSIRKTARGLGGKILSERHADDGSGAVYMLVEIPGNNISALAAKLKEAGSLRPVALPERALLLRKEKIRVRINLVPAE